MKKSEKAPLLFLIILSGFMAFTSLSTDIYLPAMPAMQEALGGRVELTVTGFVIGFAIAQLIWGPISDRIGRIKPLMIGTVLFIIGSVGCALSTSMTMVVFWRVFQAFGACTGPMISRAMIRDRYDSQRGAQMLSTLMMIMAVAPILGPLLGGLFLRISTWNLIFWFMALVGGILFLSTRLLPETLQASERSQASIAQSFKNYAQLLTTKKFMVYTMSVTFFYVAVYAFITGSSDIYMNFYHVPAEAYSLLFGVNIVGVSLMSMVNRQLVSRFSLPKLLAISTSLAFLFTLVLAFMGVTNVLGLWGIVVPMFCFFSMNGIVAACSNAAALNAVSSDMAGSAAAILGALQYGSGVIPSILLAVFADKTPATMTIIIAVAIFLSALMGWWGYREDVELTK